MNQSAVVSGEIRLKIYREYIKTAPGRAKLVASCLKPLELYITKGSELLRTGLYEGRPYDFKRGADELRAEQDACRRGEDLNGTFFFEMLFNACQGEERETTDFRRYKMLVGDWIGVEKALLQRGSA